MKFSAVCAVLIGITFIPLVSANSATVEFRNPGEAAMFLEAKIEGEQASDMREYMDHSGQGGAGGNGDGTVQQNEVDAIENFFKGFFDDEEGDSSPTGTLTVDGKAPTDFSLAQFDLRDATGPVTSTSAITMYMEFVVKFDVAAADTHTVRIEAEEGSDDGDDSSNPAGDYEITEATLKAPKGYIIESATGLPAGAEISGDKKSIHYDGLPQAKNEDTVIVFKKGASGGAPGFGFVAGLVAAVGVVSILLARRAKA